MSKYADELWKKTIPTKTRSGDSLYERATGAEKNTRGNQIKRVLKEELYNLGDKTSIALENAADNAVEGIKREIKTRDHLRHTARKVGKRVDIAWQGSVQTKREFENPNNVPLFGNNYGPTGFDINGPNLDINMSRRSNHNQHKPHKKQHQHDAMRGKNIHIHIHK